MPPEPPPPPPPITPYDYQVEYIEGDGIAYLNLGFKASALYGKHFVLRFSYPNRRATYVFGGVNGCQFVITGGLYRDDWGGSRQTVAIDQDTEYTMIQDNGRLQLNGTDFPVTRVPPEQDMYLFTRNPPEASTTFNGRIYSFIVKDGDNVIYDFFPVVKDNVAYLYDSVNEKLIGNAGSGNFIAGPRINR